MSATIEIQTSADWEKIRQENLKVVVDPMVFRTADVFLRGQNGVGRSGELKDPEIIWRAISSNIGSLCAFFDTLILEERLPMYDYGMTFPVDLQTGKHTLVELCNRDDDVLVTVMVHDQAYHEIKQAAVAVLNQQPEIHGATATDIINELSAFDWEWRPDLWRSDIEEVDQQRVLDTFRFGGILFSGYAQRTGADHILQPNRARLYLAASLGSQRADDERVLFAELMKLANETPEGLQRTADLPPTPTILPYLLKFDEETPQKLLVRALKLRKTRIVKEYRQWRKEITEDIDKGRVMNTKRRKELMQISAAIIRELGGNNNERKAAGKISAKIALVGPIPKPEIGGEISSDNLGTTLGWFLRNVPGYRYRKLLMSLVIAQREYTRIDKHLYSLWRAA
jgi:hypothetical protein